MGARVPKKHEAPNAAAAFRTVDQADWFKRLARKRNSDGSDGPILATLDNLVAILANDERWTGVIGHDDFSGTIVKRRPPPTQMAAGGEWLDEDDHRLTLWFAQVYYLRRIASYDLQSAVFLIADLNRYHQVRDYLDGLEWDGKPRLDDWLSAWLGAQQADYTRAVASKFLIQAVARVYKPGCKAENVLILESPEQGTLKSSALEVLFSPWFSDAAFELRNTQEAGQIIRGMWCIELAELDGFYRAESATAKAFFSRPRDRYRNPYGRKPVNVPRQQVFCGTVNHSTYFTDETGNRRYWPVRVALDIAIDLKGLAEVRDQLLAEAVTRFKAGEVWWVRAKEKPLFDEAQEARYVGDAYETKILHYLNEIPVGGVRLTCVSIAEILGAGLHLDTSKWTRAEQMRVGRIMQRIGWSRQRESGGERQWRYIRPGNESDE
jgi:predicted P-loop ATPase